MTGKSNIQLLIECPEAMQRFCEGLEQQVTMSGIDIEIQKLSDSLRTQLIAARACGLDPRNLLAHCRNQTHEWLLIFATAVGSERGKRLGRERGRELISEARSFGVMQTSNFEFLKPGAGMNDED